MKRLMLIFGIIACCVMFIFGFRMINQGAEVNREKEDERELMRSILNIGDAGVDESAGKYGPDGFNREGYDRNGYGRNGYSKDGYDRNGYDRDGYGKDGYDKSGFDRNGFSRYGYDKDDCDRNGICKMNWDAAVKFCKRRGKRLPTVNELLSMSKAECTGGRTSSSCDKWFWSSEEVRASSARGVRFYNGHVDSYDKDCVGGLFVRCQ